MPFYYIKAFARLIQFVDTNGPYEIIHSFLFQANIVGRLAALFCRAVNVSSVRVIEVEKKWQHIVSRLTGFMADTITVNSRRLYEFVLKTEKVPPEKVFLINNYADIKSVGLVGRSAELRKRFGCSDGDYLVVSAGRLSKQKGFEYLIEAVNLLRAEAPGVVKAVIAGEGTEWAVLQNMIRARRLEDRVVLAGALDYEDTLCLIASSDLFVLPSLWEGFPNVVLEAIAAGVPVVATASSNVEGFIEDEFIVEPSDAVSLAEKIIFAIKNTAIAKESVRKSAARLVDFSPENVFPKYFEIYKKLAP